MSRFSLLRPLLLAILLLLPLAGFCQKASLTLSSFPAISVADGHTTITITAEVRDLSGSLVRNGTPVVFESDKGTFRSRNVVETQNGFARAVLTAPGVPGTAKVRASVFSLNASAFLEIDFVNDRSLLDSAKEVIELTGKEGITYSQTDKVIEASGANKTAILRYRDIEIKAEQIQLRVPSYEVRARGAELTVGKFSSNYRELYFKLNTRKGIGLITEPNVSYELRTTPTGGYVVPVDRPIPVAYDVTAFDQKRHEGDINLGSLSFVDTSKTISTVQSKRAVVSPGRNIQFQRASVKVGGQTVMSLPLFQVDLNTSSPVITEQFLNVSNSSLAINYPYYLSLKPGETSALRFRYGNRFATGLGATNGTYLDYEYNWNKGAKMEGGLALRGLNRGDWGVGFRQYWVPDSKSSITTQIDLPAHKSLFADVGINKRFNGFQATLSAQHGRSLVGDRFTNEQVSLDLDGDPIELGKSPFNFSLGLTAQSRRITGLSSSSQTGAGLQSRINSRSLMLSPKDSLTASYSVTRWFGNSFATPLTQVGSLNLSSSWATGLFLNTAYEYSQDGFSEDILGRHRLTLDGLYTVGKLNFRTFIAKSIDIDRLSANLGLDYKLDKTWRLSTGYSMDRYFKDTFIEQTFILGYRLGFREVGLSYSTRTKRIGFELLGTRFD